MNQATFQESTNEAVNRNYAESMALAVFLLNGEGGRYREQFLDYVADCYRGREIRGLEDRFETPVQDLDKAFIRFLSQ